MSEKLLGLNLCLFLFWVTPEFALFIADFNVVVLLDFWRTWLFLVSENDRETSVRAWIYEKEVIYLAIHYNYYCLTHTHDPLTSLQEPFWLHLWPSSIRLLLFVDEFSARSDSPLPANRQVLFLYLVIFKSRVHEDIYFRIHTHL